MSDELRALVKAVAGARHVGECECEEGEHSGDPVHAWGCDLVACLLGECCCDAVALALLEEEELRWLEEGDDDV